MASTRPEIDLNLPGYEILQELGRGGVSTVYLARHELLDRQVAIKVMSPALAVEEGFNKRFLREGQTIAQFKHPGIVTVYDVAVVSHRPFIAMEYLPGGSLKDRMETPVPPEQVVALLKAIADSLGYAHGRGVFHRDVKPENILFRENGDPVLTDFGIAKSDSQDTALTSVGVVVGTPRYISPEQAQGYESDARSDIYALGVILFEMLTGRPPYDVKGSMSLLYAHINDPIPRLPEELDQYQDLLDDLLAKDPDQRIVDCRAVVRRLAEVESGSARRTRPRAARRAGSRPSWFRWPAIALAGLVVPAVALVLWSEGDRFGLATESGEQGENFREMVSALLATDPPAAPPEDAASTTAAAPEPASVSPLEQDAAAQPEPQVEENTAEQVKSPTDEPWWYDADGEAGNDEDGNGRQIDMQAAFIRAQALFYGQGTEQDVPQAVSLYEKAASAGHVLSQYYLGVAYGNGDGVKRDENEAARWLNEAAAAGDQGAKYNLILARIFGPNRNTREAARLAQELADQKYAPVYRVLGWMYNTGTGVDSNFSQSVRWNVKTVVGNVTGKDGPPTRVVRHWERQLEAELEKIREANPTRVNPVSK